MKKKVKEIKFTTTHAIVRGIAEHNDAGWFFGSTAGLSTHKIVARSEGFIQFDGYDLPTLTDQGRELYEHEIKPYNLPDCRWYFWRVKGDGDGAGKVD